MQPFVVTLWYFCVAGWNFEESSPTLRQKSYGAAEGWGSSLLAVAVAWAFELQAENRTVGHMFLVECVARL